MTVSSLHIFRVLPDARSLHPIPQYVNRDMDLFRILCLIAPKSTHIEHKIYSLLRLDCARMENKKASPEGSPNQFSPF